MSLLVNMPYKLIAIKKIYIVSKSTCLITLPQKKKKPYNITFFKINSILVISKTLSDPNL